jgi:hypothetical protein
VAAVIEVNTLGEAHGLSLADPPPLLHFASDVERVHLAPRVLSMTDRKTRLAARGAARKRRA